MLKSLPRSLRELSLLGLGGFVFSGPNSPACWLLPIAYCLKRLDLVTALSFVPQPDQPEHDNQNERQGRDIAKGDRRSTGAGRFRSESRGLGPVGELIVNTSHPRQEELDRKLAGSPHQPKQERASSRETLRGHAEHRRPHVANPDAPDRRR